MLASQRTVTTTSDDHEGPGGPSPGAAHPRGLRAGHVSRSDARTTTTRHPSSVRLDRTRPARIARWSLFLALCTVFALFAIMLGVAEVLSWVGIVDAKPRAVPIAFVLHALAGGVCLLAGGLQFSTRLRARRPAVHRLVGRTYVSAVWIASTAGLGSAVFFDVGPVARAGFIAAAVLWFTTTTIGLVLIRRGQVRRHREWMIRSFALSLFFVTGEPWTTALRASGMPEHVAFPAGMITAWSVNLLVAEARIRATRRRP